MSQEIKELLDLIKKAFMLKDREFLAVLPIGTDSVRVSFRKDGDLYQVELKVIRTKEMKNE